MLAASAAVSPTPHPEPLARRVYRVLWSVVVGIDGLARRGIAPACLAQARAMTPAAWLAWMAYDGERDLRGIVPRP